MREIGTVTMINSKRNTVKVEFPKKAECDKCGMCLRSKKDLTVSIVVKNDINAQVGDRVIVTMEKNLAIKAVFILYVIPLILLSLVLGLGRNLHELIQVALCVVALAVGVVVAYFSEKYLRNKKGVMPKIEFYTEKKECVDNE